MSHRHHGYLKRRFHQLPVVSSCHTVHTLLTGTGGGGGGIGVKSKHVSSIPNDTCTFAVI